MEEKQRSMTRSRRRRRSTTTTTTSSLLQVLFVVFLLMNLHYSLAVNGDDAADHEDEHEQQLLSYNFYEKSCPQVESIVRGTLAPMLLTDPTLAAALLRLMFHDCQVQGCDGSILLDSSNSEMGSAKNFGIRKRNTVGMIKSIVDEECPGQVSCSDILILSARDAVAASGGPEIRVPLGRRDSTTTDLKFADHSLPPPDSGVDTMIRIFAEKGMTMEESVAILGAHTLGITHCVNVLDRLHNPRHDESRQTRSGSQLFLGLSCPPGSVASNLTFVTNDATAFSFDNQYFRDTMNGRGVLRIDSDMSLDPRTAPIVERFGMDQDHFFKAFSSAFVKLSVSNVLTGNQGVIRSNCNAIV